MSDTELRRRVIGIVLFTLSIPVAFVAFMLGPMVTSGWDNADTKCAYLDNEPPIPIEIHGESGMRENGASTLFPLGITCTFEEPGDGIPPQVLAYPNWPATVVWLMAMGGIPLGFAMMFTPERWLRVRTPEDAASV